MTSRWRQWLLIGGVLLATHAATAWYYGYRDAAGGVPAAGHSLTLDQSPTHWIDAMRGADCAVYLEVAQNVAAGRGVVRQVVGSTPPRFGPFYWWAPGTPLIYGWLLRATGGQTMWPCFWFTAAAQLLFGAIVVATAALWTRNTAALALTAFCSGCCPPLQQSFYSAWLVNSEIVGLVPLALALFALSKAFLAYREADDGPLKKGTGSERTAELAVTETRPRGACPLFQRSRQAWIWFAAAGLLLGAFSLIRDCGHGFALFVGVFILGRAVLTDRRRLVLAAGAALLLVGGDMAVRAPVRRWNYRRTGTPMVCTGTAATLWQLGPWEQHNAFAWRYTEGLGFGEYLDPEAAQRVEEYYAQAKPHPELYSLGQLIQAVWKRPGDALEFKLVRQPVLWLGADMWPNTKLGIVPLWCLAFYGALAALWAVRLKRRQYLPEVLYLYLLLIVCSVPITHSELRFTFGVWSTLVLAPGLLLDTLGSEGGRMKAEG